MNKPILKYLVVILIFAIGFIACGGKNYKVLSRTQMEAVLYDLQLAESMFQTSSDNFGTKKQKDALINSILKKHNITQADLDSSLVWYSDNIELYVRVTDSILSTLKQQRDIMDKEIQEDAVLMSKRSPTGIEGIYHLNINHPVFRFKLDSALTTTYRRPNINFSVLGMQLPVQSEAVAYYTYKDTTILKRIPIVDNSTYSIPYPVTTDTLRSLSGYIRVFTTDSSIVYPKVLLYDIKVSNDSI